MRERLFAALSVVATSTLVDLCYVQNTMTWVDLENSDGIPYDDPPRRWLVLSHPLATDVKPEREQRYLQRFVTAGRDGVMSMSHRLRELAAINGDFIDNDLFQEAAIEPHRVVTAPVLDRETGRQLAAERFGRRASGDGLAIVVTRSPTAVVVDDEKNATAPAGATAGAGDLGHNDSLDAGSDTDDRVALMDSPDDARDDCAPYVTKMAFYHPVVTPDEVSHAGSVVGVPLLRLWPLPVATIPRETIGAGGSDPGPSELSGLTRDFWPAIRRRVPHIDDVLNGLSRQPLIEPVRVSREPRDVWGTFHRDDVDEGVGDASGSAGDPTAPADDDPQQKKWY